MQNFSDVVNIFKLGVELMGDRKNYFSPHLGNGERYGHCYY